MKHPGRGHAGAADTVLTLTYALADLEIPDGALDLIDRRTSHRGRLPPKVHHKEMEVPLSRPDVFVLLPPWRVLASRKSQWRAWKRW